jgi:hypothetical protein
VRGWFKGSLCIDEWVCERRVGRVAYISVRVSGLSAESVGEHE